MAVWILKEERHYKDGRTETHYHKGFPLGIMHEVVLKPEEARQYKTKRDAEKYRKEYGMAKWEAIKIA